MKSFLKTKYMREKDWNELVAAVSRKKSFITHKKAFLVFFLILAIVCISNTFGISKNSDNDDIHITYVGIPFASTEAKMNYISIPSGTVKANPFLPYRTLSKDEDRVSDIPAFELIAPPESVNENSDAARVMDTIVSGILYDKFSPSAILNIEGNDYLVKIGDVVNNYKVLNISQNSVTVKLGSNTYKAGIGEILTEGDITHNDVSNLSKKFGGERR